MSGFGRCHSRDISMMYHRFEPIRLIDDITMEVVHYPVPKRELDISGEL